ncbi:hypothetical protein ACOMHN_039676 [Nucella lapillus]
MNSSGSRISFEGLSGHVQFDRRGYRKDYKLDVITVSLDQGPHKTGEWHSERGLLQGNADEWRPPPPVNKTTKNVKLVTSILTKPFLMLKKQLDDSGIPLTGNGRYEEASIEGDERLQQTWRQGVHS